MSQICNNMHDWDDLNLEKKLFAIDIVRVIYVNFYLILFVLICFKKLQIWIFPILNNVTWGLVATG